MKKIIVAQIGVGYWGPNLLRNLMANRNCIVKTVVDLSPERRDYVRKLYPDVKTKSNPEEILSDPEIEAIVIATPAATHFDLSMQCLQAGKHVLVEKPAALSVGGVDRLSAVACKKKTVVMVGHTFLYNAAVRCLRNLIVSGELGDVRYIYTHRLSLGRIRSDVDVLWNLAPHDVSIVQYLLNDLRPVSVTKSGVAYVQPNINDVAFLNILYPDRIMAHVHVSWLDPFKVRRVTVVGSKKMAVYDDVAVKKVAIYDKGIDRMAVLGEGMDYDRKGNIQFNHRSGGVYYPKFRFQEPLKVEIAHFVDCVRNGVACLTDLEHARKVVEILSW